MKLQFLLISSLILLWSEAYSQIMFQRVYGGDSYDTGCEVIQTSDDGYLIAGTTGSFGFESGQVMIIKTDLDGYEEWRKYIEAPLAQQARSMQESIDGGFIIGGFSQSMENSYQMFAAKVTSVGDTVWTDNYGGSEWDFCNQVATLNDGGAALFGTTYSYGNGEGDFYLIRIDADGDTLWTRSYGGFGMESGEAIAVASDGGFYLAGNTESFGAGGSDMYVVRTDANGDTLWTRTWGGLEDDFCYAVSATPNDGYVLAGGTFNNTPDKSDFVIVMEDGLQQWVKYETKPGDNYLTDVIIEQGTNNVTVTGYATGGGDFGGEDARILRYGFDGVWNGVAKFHGSEANERTYDIKRTSDNGYVMVGYSTGFLDRFDDVYLIKTNDQGLTVNPELGVNEIEIAGEIFEVSVAPNPVSDDGTRLLIPNYEQLKLMIDDNLFLRVYNSVGQLVKQEAVTSGSQQLGELNFPSGVYHYQLTSESTVLATGKLIKLN